MMIRINSRTYCNRSPEAFQNCSGRSDSVSAISRRRFLRQLFGYALLSGGGLCLPYTQSAAGSDAYTAEIIRRAPVARYWVSASAPSVDCMVCHQSEDKVQGVRFDHDRAYVKCLLCAQQCLINPGERGKCRARMNVDGQLKSLVYGRPVSVHVDPIEKKPFYHFLPGSAAFSLATAGCPLNCKFCQNWEISQAAPEDIKTQFVLPEVIVASTKKSKAAVVAYTYNEPTVFAEYLTDIAAIGRKQGLRNVLISCGFMNPEALADMCEVLDAIKIDLKGFSPDFYRNVCGARLEPVLRSIRAVSKTNVHLEIVNLVVPTLNDSDKMLTELVKWVAGEIGSDVPLHFTRFHPDYQMPNLPPTPVETLEKAYETAKRHGIRYPYVGNVPGHQGNNTYCPSCGKAVVSRVAFFVRAVHLKDGRCAYCGTPVAGVWS